MTNPDLKAMAEKMSGAVRAYVARAAAPLVMRLDAIESRTEAQVSAPTKADIDALIQRLATAEFRCNVLALAIARSNPEGVAELEKLIARIEALEARPAGMKYAGTYREGIDYEPGSVCTFDGSMWHAENKTAARPGTSREWVLCVKHGRDLRA